LGDDLGVEDFAVMWVDWTLAILGVEQEQRAGELFGAVERGDEFAEAHVGVVEGAVELGGRRAGAIGVAGEALPEGDVLGGACQFFSSVSGNEMTWTRSGGAYLEVGTVERWSAIRIHHPVGPFASRPIPKGRPEKVSAEASITTLFRTRVNQSKAATSASACGRSALEEGIYSRSLFLY
jgi:hypothetical protein